MSRFRRTYGQGAQLITDTIGGVTYDYAVDTYAELPSNPPDEMVVFVSNVAGPVSYGYYVYDTVMAKWYLTYGMVNAFADIPATQVLYNTGITVELSLFSELAVFTEGRAVICTDPVIPTWDEQMPGVSVADYTDLPLTPPTNYKIGCTNTSLAGLGPLQSVILQHDTGNNWFVIKAQINDVSQIPGSTTVFSDATYTVIATGGTILYSADRAWLYTGVVWQEYTPDFIVASFASLPLSPPDDSVALVTVDQGSMFTPIFIQYNAISDEWEIVTTLWELPSTLPDLSTPFYDVGGITVVGKVGTLLNSLGRTFTWGGVSWTETLQYSSRNWGALANEATVNTAIGSTYQVNGDTFIDQSLAGTVTKIWDTAQWYYYKIDWDGVSVGQTIADLPSSNIATGALAVVGASASEWDGASWAGFYAGVSVATFSLLPAGVPVGHRVLVTAEGALTSVVVVAGAASNIWGVERVTCASTSLPALGATGEVWYSSGGISVSSLEGCVLFDTTSNVVRRWWAANTLGTTGVWIDPEVYFAGTKTLCAWCEGTENNTALGTQGWTVTITTGGTSTVTVATDGTRIVCTATSDNSASNLRAALRCSDASLTSAANVWACGLVDLNTPTGHTCIVNVALQDGADDWQYGTVTESNALKHTGRWHAQAYPYTAFPEQIIGNLVVNTESMLEFHKRSGFAQTRKGGRNGVWTALSSTTAVASANKFWYWPQVYIPVSNPSSSTATTAKTCIVRYS